MKLKRVAKKWQHRIKCERCGKDVFTPYNSLCKSCYNKKLKDKKNNRTEAKAIIVLTGTIILAIIILAIIMHYAGPML